MIATGSIVDGHGLLSDWLFLIAAVVFLIAAVLAHVRSTPVVEGGRRVIITWAEVACIGLCVASVGFLVL